MSAFQHVSISAFQLLPFSFLLLESRMADGGQSGIPARNAGNVAEAPGAKRILASARPLRARDVQLYRACEDLTEPLIYLLVVFGPWAFGTTQSCPDIPTNKYPTLIPAKQGTGKEWGGG